MKPSLQSSWVIPNCCMCVLHAWWQRECVPPCCYWQHWNMLGWVPAALVLAGFSSVSFFMCMFKHTCLRGQRTISGVSLQKHSICFLKPGAQHSSPPALGLQAPASTPGWLCTLGWRQALCLREPPSFLFLCSLQNVTKEEALPVSTTKVPCWGDEHFISAPLSILIYYTRSTMTTWSKQSVLSCGRFRLVSPKSKYNCGVLLLGFCILFCALRWILVVLNYLKEEMQFRF